MGALALLGLVLAGFAFSRGSRGGSSRSSRRSSSWSSSTSIGNLDPHQAALRVGWTNTQQGAPQARAVISSWLGTSGRTAIQAGAFAHELQELHQEALADFALDTWNTLHAPSSSVSSSTSAGQDALSADDAARAVQRLSNEDERDHLIALWLARPGRTAIEAGRFSQQLQSLGLSAEAEFAMDTWNERPTG